jgi:hypothetical protein
MASGQTAAEARTDSVRARGPAPQERHGGNGRVPDFQPKHDPKSEDELYRRLRQQDKLVFAVGLLLLAVGAAAIYLYWDHARPFVATDDPFLAARQFPIVVRTIPAPAQPRLTLDNDGPSARTSKAVGQRSSRSEAPRRENLRACVARKARRRMTAPNSRAAARLIALQ